ncbi:general stress protein [Fictibacillus nanhaiensis]|uniref:general stress protein n=1 Tax=Fictibacillus nanhaiensis TaxID=742169 RepID=UPI00203AC339|nr:general stress protein [Fictibacillus nanhaiensis]MCM3731884.1 general stress protein [Fictibacillus nanhaiensis]
MIKPIVHEFNSQQELIAAASDLKAKGIHEDNLYVLSHEKSDTRDLADNADLNTIGLKEEGLGTAFSNVFESRGDELRNKMTEIGLSDVEADQYEKRLDMGKILLIVKDEDKVTNLP